MAKSRKKILTNHTSKKINAKKLAKLERRTAEYEKISNDPSLFYQLHSNYESMLYLVHMLDKTTIDMENISSVVFDNDAHSYKDMVKANYKAIEAIRKDTMIFADPKSEQGQNEYIEAVTDSNRLLQLFNMMVEIVQIKNDAGFLQLESAIKLILTPDIQKANRERVTQDIIKAHQCDFPSEVLQKWIDFKNNL